MTRTAVAAAVALALLVPARALAGIKPEAQAKITQGEELYKAGKIDEALAAFRAAYELDKQAAYSLATAYRYQGRCDLAIGLYREFIATKPGEEGVQLTKLQIAECVLSMDLTKADDDDNQIVITQPAVELPWYKTPLGGAAVIGTVGVASLAVGISWMVAATTTRNQMNNARFSDDFNDLRDEATGERRIGATFLAAGGLLTAGAFVYYILKSPPKSEPTTAVATDGRSVFFARSF